jgi:hypothetical protein
VDDMVNDAVGTLRRAWRRPRAAGLGAPVVGAGASEHHLAFSSRVEWFYGTICVVCVSRLPPVFETRSTALLLPAQDTHTL